MNECFSTKTEKMTFFQRLATSGRHNDYGQKYITKWSLYGKSGFHFYRWNQFKVIALACTVRTWNFPPKFSATSAYNANISQSQAASDDRLLSPVTLGRVECTK